MVVSAESQKINRKNSKGQVRYFSSFSVRKTSVPLYIIPFISALLFFSVILNFIEVLWQRNEPHYNIEHLILPGEKSGIPEENRLMKAAAPFYKPSDGYLMEKNDGIQVSEYTLREGDRFSIIAGKYNVSLDTLISINNLSENSIAEEGLVIRIPDKSGIFHKVVKNDTLISIAEKYNLDIMTLQDANNLISTVIRIGQNLFIPDGTLPDDTKEKIIGSRFIIPAEGAVKNNYGAYLDPVTGLKYYNYGIDIVNKKGTPVYAAKSGIIGNTSYNAYYGRVIQLNHSDSMQTIFSCLDSIVVKPGDKVERGDLLGYMGNSGFRAGEHLQFSIFKNKEDVDTLEFIF
ncbi:peptidoglycan DD-metalloendopeptidase family protein [Spirochaeta isovalerica]|uniref:LysM repeat protein n=1 Tax=Spirochaeta isovalerica TaxID=150 RepID=A0A841R6Q8_9SPIO|nr:M23 family metallopeptidase [Spirochaeta isovalerica]MBB6478669.1 LysM repeat protein [Spirochaeta isovalerica]